MTTPDEVAAAFVKIEPDTSGFERDLERKLQLAINQAMSRVRVQIPQAVAPQGASGWLTASQNAQRYAAAVAAANAASRSANAGFQDLISGSTQLGGSLDLLVGKFARLGAVAVVIGGVTGALRAMVQATAELGFEISKIGLESASGIQNTQLQISALNDQLEDISVKNVIDQLREFSILSGISLDQLSKAEQGLVAVGFTGTEALQTINAQLSGLAASGKLGEEAFAGVNRAIQQISAKPFLQLEELNQVAEHLPAASRVKIIQRIAEDTGDTVAEVQERFRLGTQLSGDAITALIEVIAGVDTQGDALERRLNTLSGAFASFQQKARLALGDLFKPLADDLAAELNDIDVEGLATRIGTPLANALQDIVPEAVEAIPDVVEGIALAFELLAPAVGEGVSLVGDFFGFVSDNRETIQDLGSDVSDIAQAIGGILGPAIQDALASMALWVPILDGTAAAFRILEPALEAAGPAVSFLINPFERLITIIDLAAHAIEQLLDAVALIPESIPILGSISDGAGDAASRIHDLRNEINNLGAAANNGPDLSVHRQAIAGPAAAARAKAAGLNRTPVIPNSSSAEEAARRKAEAAAEAAAAKARAQAERIADIVKGLFRQVRDVGTDLTSESADQILNQYRNLFDKVWDLFEERGIVGTKRANAAYAGLVKRGNEVVRLARQLDPVNKALEEASNNIDEAIRVRDDFGKGVAESISQTLNIVDISKEAAEKTMTWIEEARERARLIKFGSPVQDGSFTKTASRMKKLLADTQEFSDSIKQLIDQGLNKTSGQQFLDAGVSSLPQIRELLGGGSGAINELNAIQTEFDAIGESLGNKTANAFFDAGVQAANGIFDGLDSQRDKLEARMRELGEQIANGVKKALKIQSPSKVMIEIGSQVPAGLAEGIVSTVPKVGVALKSMYDKLVPTSLDSSRFAVAAQQAPSATGSNSSPAVSGRDGNVIYLNFGGFTVSGVNTTQDAARVGRVIAETVSGALAEQRAAQILGGS